MVVVGAEWLVERTVRAATDLFVSEVLRDHARAGRYTVVVFPSS